MTNLKNQRHHFANKGPYSQSYGFSSSHYGCESWTIKKAEHQRCFQTVVLEKTHDSPLDSREIKPVNPNIQEINPEYSLEGLMLKLKLQHLGHLMQRADSLEMTPVLRKIEGRGERGNRGWDV